MFPKHDRNPTLSTSAAAARELSDAQMHQIVGGNGKQAPRGEALERNGHL